jgi:outer membrane protein OmpA-like peptidoglycan-associated protein
MFMELHLQDGSVLDATSTKGLNWGLKEFELDQLKEFIIDPEKSIKKLFPKKVEVTVFTVTEGFGAFGTLDTLRPIQLPEDKVRENPTKSGTPRCESHTYFDVDSALISKEMRDSLERGLAVFRKLFTEAEAQASAEAFASPEDTEEHNQTLTDARAAAVKRAVEDAFGADLVIKDFTHVGYGEKPATDPQIGGLLDPEKADAGQADRIQREKETAWPLWRRVDLWVVGWLILRLKPI